MAGKQNFISREPLYFPFTYGTIKLGEKEVFGVQGNTWVIWLVLLAASLALEAIGRQLFSLWFALGAAAALISCALGAPAWMQAALFAVATALGLAASRPLVRRLREKARPAEEPARGEEALP